MSQFVLRKAIPAILVAVTFSQPQADGSDQAATIQFTFKHLAPKDVDKLFEDHPVVDGASIATLMERNAALFGKAITGWDVIDEDGTPVPFTPQALADLITGPDGPAISRETFEAWGNARFGLRAATAKNLPTPLAAG